MFLSALDCTHSSIFVRLDAIFVEATIQEHAGILSDAV